MRRAAPRKPFSLDGSMLDAGGVGEYLPVAVLTSEGALALVSSSRDFLPRELRAALTQWQGGHNIYKLGSQVTAGSEVLRLEMDLQKSSEEKSSLAARLEAAEAELDDLRAESARRAAKDKRLERAARQLI